MRQIDLCCKLLGPLALSIVDQTSTSIAIWLVFSLNVASLPIEYISITQVSMFLVFPLQHILNEFLGWQLTHVQVYVLVPGLQVVSCPETSESESLSTASITNSTSSRSWFQPLIRYIHTFYDGLRFYFHHATWMPSFAASLLYLTVLSFSGQMIAYLLFTGYSSSQIGLLRTVTVAVEISATWIAPLFMCRIGTTRSALWFITWQMTCIAVGTNCFLLGRKPDIPTTGLIVGVLMSRVGLWGFDLCVQSLIQEVGFCISIHTTP